MIGNDIIDLTRAAINSSWRRKGFLSKIFSQNEQEYIFQAKNKDEMVWRLWSMKESAYKVHLRHTRNRIFAPAKLFCIVYENNFGLVRVDGFEYYTHSTINNKFIHTIASHNKGIDLTAEVQVNSSHDFINPTYSPYNQAKETLANKYGIKISSIQIVKDNLNIPSFHIKGEFQYNDISFSHHGDYVSWCFLNP